MNEEVGLTDKDLDLYIKEGSIAPTLKRLFKINKPSDITLVKTRIFKIVRLLLLKYLPIIPPPSGAEVAMGVFRKQTALIGFLIHLIWFLLAGQVATQGAEIGLSSSPDCDTTGVEYTLDEYPSPNCLPLNMDGSTSNYAYFSSGDGCGIGNCMFIQFFGAANCHSNNSDPVTMPFAIGSQCYAMPYNYIQSTYGWAPVGFRFDCDPGCEWLLPYPG